ncbi:MAG: class I SAM-dependent methyltransferase [Pseudomonadota bacterium]
MSESSALEFTGERFTPECVREMAYEHWHRYAWASAHVQGKRVLDAACGEGYGSQLLSAGAEHVIGVDLSAEAVKHAKGRYTASNLEFHQADVTQLPLADDSVDVVVSFETLEHLEAQDDMFAEFRRVLRPDGFLLVSSPDRRTYSDDTGYDNPFHVRELYRDEFEALLGRHFPAFRLFGQKLMFVSALWSLDQGGGAIFHTDHGGKVEHGAQPALPPLYFIAVAAASEEQLPVLSAVSLYGDRDESVYEHYNDEIRKHIRAGHLLAERDAEIAELKARLEQAG